MFDSIPMAAEARKQVVELNSEVVLKKIGEVSQEIKKAINECKTSCTIIGFLPIPLVSDLRKKGYTVEEGSQKNEDYTYIS